MANKKQRTIYLSPSVWAQVDDLINYFGDSQHEVLAHVLNDWFSRHQDEITTTKARIDGLGSEIAVIREQAEKEGKKKSPK